MRQVYNSNAIRVGVSVSTGRRRMYLETASVISRWSYSEVTLMTADYYRQRRTESATTGRHGLVRTQHLTAGRVE